MEKIEISKNFFIPMPVVLVGTQVDGRANFMVVPGFPVLGVGREIGEVSKDEEGIGRAREAGKNMAWLIKATEKARNS